MSLCVIALLVYLHSILCTFWGEECQRKIDLHKNLQSIIEDLLWYGHRVNTIFNGGQAALGAFDCLHAGSLVTHRRFISFFLWVFFRLVYAAFFRADCRSSVGVWRRKCWQVIRNVWILCTALAQLRTTRADRVDRGSNRKRRHIKGKRLVPFCCILLRGIFHIFERKCAKFLPIRIFRALVKRKIKGCYKTLTN